MTDGRADGRTGGGFRHVLVLVFLSVCPSARPPVLQAQATLPQLLSGQELIYSGHFGAAQVYFSDLARQYPADPAAPALEASALIWWAEARGDESYQADVVDSLLAVSIARANVRADSAPDDATRRSGLFWLGTAYGYRARQAEMRGSVWRAARDARAMQSALERAMAADSACVDCVLGLGIYDYALARSSSLARLVARIIGLGGGDAGRGLARMRLAADSGALTRTEARWVYANALLREGEHDPAQREDGRRRIAELAEQFPDNPLFQRGGGVAAGETGP